MKRNLFASLLLAFSAALLAFVLIVAGIFYVGFRQSRSAWSAATRTVLAERIEEGLRELGTAPSPENKRELADLIRGLAPPEAQVLVYDAGRRLIYSQGPAGGMHRSMAGGMGMGPGGRYGPAGVQVTPVTVDGRLVGFYGIGPVGMAGDRAADTFLRTMRVTVLTGLVLAFALALAVAFLLSRRFSRSTGQVADGIDRMSRGNLSEPITGQEVLEIDTIARSANILARQLRDQERLRRQWAEDIAHDLRTPVAALKSQLEAMADGVLAFSPDRVRGNLRELDRIENLVRDLAELTRLESPELRLNRTRVNVEDLFSGLAHRFERRLADRGVRLSLHSETPAVHGDQELLLRALSNVTDNAARHTPRGGQIRLNTDHGSEGVRISVFNTGEPLPEEELERVFDRLYRGEYARSTPGSGLGLTIARQIARLHGGDAVMRNVSGGVRVELRIGEER